MHTWFDQRCAGEYILLVGLIPFCNYTTLWNKDPSNQDIL